MCGAVGIGGMPPPAAATLRPRCSIYFGLPIFPLAVSFLMADFLAGDCFAEMASLCASCCATKMLCQLLAYCERRCVLGGSAKGVDAKELRARDLGEVVHM